MKKTTKAILIIGAFILTIGSCQKETSVKPAKIDFGTKSTSMNFASQIMLVNTNVYAFDVYTTPGAKYSIQVTDIKGDVVLSQGLSADEEKETITVNMGKYPKGVYDLIFMDIQGNEIKQPLIIK